VLSGWIKRWFPEFEFTWLAEEMRENLPKELDFTNEARNARKAVNNFKNSKTSLYIPEVISADKRVLIMEFIEGARVDDLEYLAAHNIDRNKVSLELSRIFSQMVYLDGWFHAVSFSRCMFDIATNPWNIRTHIQVFSFSWVLSSRTQCILKETS
jgi:aarF domain-containing kinase